MQKIMISVAPVSAADTFNDPAAIARDVYECYKNGAAMVHLHCRDRKGQLTPDLSVLEETVRLIREKCPIIIEISTGGVSDLSIEDRCAPCTPDWVECNSLNVGSVNLGDAVYKNPIGDVRYCVDQIIRNRKIPEVEVFEPGMINTTRELAEQFDFTKPILFAIVLGHIGAMPATVPSLSLMLQALDVFFPNREDVIWGLTEAHRTDWALVEAALDRGARTVRIGFEDSDCLLPGVRAETNAPMIAELTRRIRAKGMEPMTPDEAREMLRIPAE